MFETLYEDDGPFMQYYREETEKFYCEFFNSRTDMEEFFMSVIKTREEDPVPMQMINQVRRFVCLSKNIEKIYPARDPLRILFLRICMESLQYLSGQKNTKQFMSNFLKTMEPEGKAYILENFKLSSIDFDEAAFSCLDEQHTCPIPSYYWFQNDFQLENLFVVIKKIRDTVVHEGTFWETVIFGENEKCPAITSFRTKADESIFPLKNEGIIYSGFCTYVFNTTLSFEKFIWYFVRTCIEYIKSYVDTI